MRLGITSRTLTVVTQMGGHGGLSLAVEGHGGHLLLRRESAMPSRGMVAATKESSAALYMTNRLTDLHREMIAALIGNLPATIDLSTTGKKINTLTSNLQAARGSMTGMTTEGDHGMTGNRKADRSESRERQ
jgi:hypothetical protein